MQTQPHPAQSRLPQAQTPKEEFVKLVRSYIKHCKLVCTNSHSDYYRTLAKARAWDFVSDLNKMLLDKDQHSFSTLKNFTRITQAHLHNILPHPDNTSYKNSVTTFEKIISLCKN